MALAGGIVALAALVVVSVGVAKSTKQSARRSRPASSPTSAG